MRNTHLAGLVLILTPLLLPARPVQGQEREEVQLVNPDFAEGLTGWTALESGSTGLAGGVTPVAGGALLAEGDSFLVSLSQSFVAGVGMERLSFSLTLEPGFDRRAAGVPDAFEVSLLDASALPVTAPWRAGATSLFNLQEDGTVHLGAGVSYVAGEVSVDLTGLDPRAGQELTLLFTLIGGDGDSGSALTLGGLHFGMTNRAPHADAGPDALVECASAGTTEVLLDGAASSDPDGQPLSFEWRDEAGTVLGSTVQVRVPQSRGSRTYTLTVEDGLGGTDSDTVTITVRDTTPPAIDPPAERAVVAVACAGVVPDLRAALSVGDACSAPGAVRVEQEPAPDTALVLDQPTTVTLQATDEAGNTGEVTAVVTLVDPDGTCAPADAGVVEPDASVVEPDAGVVEQDAGPVAEDAGPVAEDAGPVAEDAGPVVGDAGPVAEDAGPVVGDAGPVVGDVGGPRSDAGLPGPDLGPGPADAGPRETDQGNPAPPGEGEDGGGLKDDGCGCFATPGGGAAPRSGGLGLALLGLGLGLLRRRWR